MSNNMDSGENKVGFFGCLLCRLAFLALVAFDVWLLWCVFEWVG